MTHVTRAGALAGQRRFQASVYLDDGVFDPQHDAVHQEFDTSEEALAWVKLELQTRTVPQVVVERAAKANEGTPGWHYGCVVSGVYEPDRFDDPEYGPVLTADFAEDGKRWHIYSTQDGFTVEKEG